MNVLRWCPFVHLLATLFQNPPYGHVTHSFQKQQFTDVIQNRCSYKFLKIHRKTPVLEYLFNKVAGPQACNFNPKRLQHRCFPVNFAKFLRAPFLQNTSDDCFCHFCKDWCCSRKKILASATL